MGGATESVECVDNNLLSFNTFREIMELKIEFIEKQERYFRNVDPIGKYQQVIGAWVDVVKDPRGMAYIEISDVVKSKKMALELAKARGEKAIYDFANSETIYL